tara:strand:- start:1041 stop:1415 length:375 start_codon:yes stop_codon:yes gene_type:complete
MAKVKVGDLVCMYRRKNKGMGIVLEHTSDLMQRAEAGITFDDFMDRITELSGTYAARAEYRRELKARAKYPDMINTCMTYNAGWAKKPKKEFVRIRWFEAPSMYEVSQIREIEEWCPIDWVKTI